MHQIENTTTFMIFVFYWINLFKSGKVETTTFYYIICKSVATFEE